jgi:hypothetical protein
MYRLIKSCTNYSFSSLINLIVRSDIKEDNLVLKFDVDNTDIARYGECAPAPCKSPVNI